MPDRRVAVTLPDPVPQEPLPKRAFVIYVGVWVPLLFVEIADEDVPALEEMFGANALHEMTSIEFELARGIDVSLTHAQRLLERRPNGLVGRGGPKRAIDWTGYPALHADGQIRPTAGVELMTPQCHFVALNLSKQDDPTNELDPGSPVPVATKVAAQQVLVVVAAGNEGEQEGLRDTSSPWARPDWVVSVGASDDEDGTYMAPYSGTGPGVPDFVAWGRSGLDDEVTGTSFATPRVTRQVLVLAAALHALSHAIQVACGESVGGVPLVGELMVDTSPPGWRDPQLPIPAYPLVAIDQEAVADALQALGEDVSEVKVVPNPKRLRRMLERSARPMTNGGPGFISPTTTREYLAKFNGFELARLGLDRPVHGQDERLRRPLFAASELDKAIEVWDRGALHLYYEHETGEITLN